MAAMVAVTEALLDRVRAAMRQPGGVKVPGPHDKVHKDECMLSFDTPESPGGLYVNLQTLQGFGDEYVALDHTRTGNVLYLHQKWHKVPIVEEVIAAQAKPDKLAIGGEGGFQVNSPSYTIEKAHALVLLPDRAVVALPCTDLPELVLQALAAVIAHESVTSQETVAAWEEERKVSRHAEALPQLDTGRKISPNPSEWRCDETGEADNLWLNLSTGYIGSGRKNYDGSGGNGSALRHYEATGKQYPLSVKLGTITPHGADVFSYPDDDMVTDPHLSKHLAHWGINMMQMERTVKTMAELNIDMNLRAEFNKITESGTELKALDGPGYTGLINLGNSCYMNSILQVLWSVPELSERYVTPATTLFSTAPQDVSTDLGVQMAKVGVALVHGRTGHVAPTAMEIDEAATGDGTVPKPPADEPRAHAVKPLVFKTLVGRGHAEFSSARQQDAVEYFQHLLDLLSRNERANGARMGLSPAAPPSSAAFTYTLETRIQCQSSGRVSYRTASDNVLSLDIPLEAAVNKADVEDYKERDCKRQKLKEQNASAYISSSGEGTGAAEVVASDVPEEPVIPQVPFDACLQRLTAAEVMDDYHSAVLGRKTTATKRVQFATFPPYLAVQLKRYYVAQDWTPKKMEVLVQVPDRLDLEGLRSKGVQPGEELQPEDATASAAAAPAASAAAPAPLVADPSLVEQLVGMGFGHNGCCRAAVATRNSGVEAAMEWVFGHMEDADFNDPLPVAAPPAASVAAAAAPAAAADPEKVAMLVGMGFSDVQAGAALQACGGSIERAGDWLFSHMDDLDSAVAIVLSGQAAAPAAAAAAAAPSGGGAAAGPAAGVLDGPGTYELLGFVSHMGSNTACGHYVAHIKKGGRWVIFNDEKVAESANPPLTLGYLYFYKRVVAPSS